MAELFSIVDNLVDPDLPSYSEATTNTNPSLSSLRSALPSSSSSSTTPYQQPPPPGGPSNLITSLLTSHFTSLPDQIRTTHAQHLTTQTSHDLDQLDLLTPHITHFLTTLGPITHASLTLIPRIAVPPGWALSGAAELRRSGSTVVVARVETPLPLSSKEPSSKKSGRLTPESDGDGSNKAARASEFDEWGRFNDDEGTPSETNAGEGTFFRDERMARRLAGYLAPVHVARREVREAVVVEQKEQKKGWFGRKREEKNETRGAVSAPVPVPTTTTTGISGVDERVSLGVRAQEVTFRRENDWGVWESLSGFGIVVSVRVRKG